MKITCKICGGESGQIFKEVLLKKYEVSYYQCKKCGFIQTEKPYWLQEAYTSAITSIDVGLIYRNLYFADIIPQILDSFSGVEDSFLDYGGGYGMFVRIMRDKGFYFYLHDMYADNLFAKHFELNDYKGGGKFKALTAFEVFEHLEDPLQEIEKMLTLSDTIIFSTDLQPATTFQNAGEWWYFTPETGQHISFYNTRSLEIIGEINKCTVYSNGNNLHILTRNSQLANPFLPKSVYKPSILQRVVNRLERKPPAHKVSRSSLLQVDFDLYRKKLNMNG